MYGIVRLVSDCLQYWTTSQNQKSSNPKKRPEKSTNPLFEKINSLGNDSSCEVSNLAENRSQNKKPCFFIPGSKAYFLWWTVVYRVSVLCVQSNLYCLILPGGYGLVCLVIFRGDGSILRRLSFLLDSGDVSTLGQVEVLNIFCWMTTLTKISVANSQRWAVIYCKGGTVLVTPWSTAPIGDRVRVSQRHSSRSGSS